MSKWVALESEEFKDVVEQIVHKTTAMRITSMMNSNIEDMIKFKHDATEHFHTLGKKTDKIDKSMVTNIQADMMSFVLRSHRIP